MKNKGSKEDCWRIIEKSGIVVLTTHIRPDGDGIASELALYGILKKLGKDVYIVNQDKTPEMYRWLANANRIIDDFRGKPPIPENIELAVLLDCSSDIRIGRVKDYIEKSKYIISLDHHEDSECYRDLCYVDTDASSIGELIIDLVPDIWDLVDKDIAESLYVSILTDTGSFSYGNTTSRVFEKAARLLEYGIKPEYIYRMVYNNKSINHLKLLGKTLEKLELAEDGKIAYVLLPISVYKETRATEEDNEGILEVIRTLRGVEFIILLRELDNNILKGSLRSEEMINCNHLAKMFGGGGHFKASGFVVEGNINEDGHRIVNKIIEEVKKQGWL